MAKEEMNSLNVQAVLQMSPRIHSGVADYPGPVFLDR